MGLGRLLPRFSPREGGDGVGCRTAASRILPALGSPRGTALPWGREKIKQLQDKG